MEECIFCRIINKEIPAAIVYEDQNVVAFLDIAPINAGHTLVVPKQHAKNILEQDLADLDACLTAVQTLAPTIMKVTSAQGFNVGVNTGKVAGQAVFHTHLHIIPRFEDDGLKHWAQGNYEEGEMQLVRDRIVEALSL